MSERRPIGQWPERMTIQVGDQRLRYRTLGGELMVRLDEAAVASRTNRVSLIRGMVDGHEIPEGGDVTDLILEGLDTAANQE